MLSYHNRKINHLQEALGVKCAAFDLPCGWSCPFAKDCKTRVDDSTGKRCVQRFGIFECYAAKAELVYPKVFSNRRVNFAVSKTSEFVKLIMDEIDSHKLRIVRIHSSGDFYNPKYFEKWRSIAAYTPGTQFFGYTKSVAAVQVALEFRLPNFHLIYSWGGVADAQAAKLGLPTCHVDMHGECEGKMPVIDSDKNAVLDYEYVVSGTTFAIRLH